MRLCGKMNNMGNFICFQNEFNQIRRTNISSYKYEILKYESQLNKLISSNINYYLAPNIYGKNCFLVFTKIGDKYYCFLVDKKQLSYDYDKLDFSKIMVYNYNVVVELGISSSICSIDVDKSSSRAWLVI